MLASKNLDEGMKDFMLDGSAVRLVLVFAWAALVSFACDCRRLPVCRLIEEGTPVFIGEVIEGGVSSLRDDPWRADVRRVKFKVLENFRGLPAGAKTVDLHINPPFGMCSPIPYFPGKKYLVFPSKTQAGELSDGICFQGRDIEATPEDVRQVRDYFSGEMRARLIGQIGMAGGTRETFPGVKISTSGRGQVFNALTNSEGRYELNLPTAGAYQLRATLAPYFSEAPTVYVSKPGCALQDLYFKIDNTISGKVLDEESRLSGSAEVGLIRLGGGSSGQSKVTGHAYTKKGDMTFQFTDVPLGRYLVAFNPDGPHSTRLIDEPLETSYYPPHADRKAAKIIDVNSSGVHLTGINVAVGEPVRFRTVAVRVRFPDGSPMTTAEVECIGSPLGQEDLPWVEQLWVDQNGLARFTAPEKRDLVLSVRDLYGRDLKGVYRAKHAAGKTPISQDFVITP